MLAELFNEHKLVRRASLVVLLTLTVLIFKWATVFATESQRSGTDVAMIIAAILTPLSTLQGFVFKFYNEARKEEDK